MPSTRTSTAGSLIRPAASPTPWPAASGFIGDARQRIRARILRILRFLPLPRGARSRASPTLQVLRPGRPRRWAGSAVPRTDRAGDAQATRRGGRRTTIALMALCGRAAPRSRGTRRSGTIRAARRACCRRRARPRPGARPRRSGRRDIDGLADPPAPLAGGAGTGAGRRRDLRGGPGPARRSATSACPLWLGNDTTGAVFFWRGSGSRAAVAFRPLRPDGPRRVFPVTGRSDGRGRAGPGRNSVAGWPIWRPTGSCGPSDRSPVDPHGHFTTGGIDDGCCRCCPRS